jgi:hypothetical protein
VEAAAASAVDVDGAIARFRDRGAVVVERERNGKVQRFALEREVVALEPAGPGRARLTLGMTANGASLRPEEVLQEIFGEARAHLQLVREDLLVELGGNLVGPLAVAPAIDAERAVR